MSILNNTTSLEALLAKANLLSNADSVRPSEFPSLGTSILNNTARLRYLLEQATGLPAGGGGESTNDGLFDANGVQLASWDELVNTYGLDVSKNYTTSSYKTDIASLYYILKNNGTLTSGIELIIPDTVTSIGNNALRECTSLTSVTIPDTVTSIGNYAFLMCTSLTSVTIPDSVTNIGTSAFKDCTSLISVTISDNLTKIVGSVFMNCTSLTSVTIPDSVTSIGNYAFYGCTSLTSVTIPDTVTEIKNYAFESCTSLTSVYFEHTTAPTFNSGCFYKASGGKCTFYFKNSTVRSKFTTSYYNSSYGTLSTKYNW